MSPEMRTGTFTAPELDDAFEQELQQMALEVSAPPLEEPREPGLGRYLQFQIKDFIKHRGAALILIALVGLWILHYNYAPMIAERAARHPDFDAGAERMLFRTIVTGGALLFGGLGSLIASVGIVSRDREGGHQKFLFAKPVRITRFYLQAFAVNGIGLLACAFLMLLLTSVAFLRPVPMVEPLLAIGATYAAVGGLVFLLSTLVRFDLAAGLMLALLSFPLREMANRGHWWAVATYWLLPPVHLLEALNPMPGPHTPSIVQMLGSLVAYGAAYVGAGLAVLKKRSIMR
ncbi:hypothetical protein J421_4208 [Gemmatirosa kalamazoonensis]|uniref:ABC-2 family transporter protein n=1 Tax=Gemmatirosa kalamazoonensis TaxID=861299 RepID=W0RN58_9BACT|nr:hypothetical protein [Gemmatirosa kalamazoonensis]AHG91745.1 hypothetical protein J421_4208 [Gemmatirosa kalamazoonensis]